MSDSNPKPTTVRFFLCTGECVRYEELSRYPDSHIMGHLTHVTDEGRQLTALARWEVSVATVKVPPLKPVIDCFYLGDARGIRCRHPGCQRRQRWEIGKAAFLVLMARYGKERLDESV